MVIQRWANEGGPVSGSAAHDEEDRSEPWEETVWSVGLIGSVLLAIAAIAQFAV